MISVSRGSGELKARILLPGSKSISNRLLILQFHYGEKLRIENLSHADDTILLASILALVKRYQDNGSQGILHLDAHNAGTVFRFLTALLAITRGNFYLTGHGRMKERPIGPLVEALNSIGADVEYVERVGFAPLFIKGHSLEGGNIRIDASLSSQFLSALMLISPMLENGLCIENTKPVASWPYVRMTRKILEDLRIRTSVEKNSIKILPGARLDKIFKVEPDWSAASFWYCMMALNGKGEIRFPGLFHSGYQGDEIIADIFNPLGIVTVEDKEGTVIRTGKKGVIPTTFDFSEIPDLAMPVMLAMAAEREGCAFSGLEKLRFKESDRLSVMERELGKVGISLKKSSLNKWETSGKLVSPCDIFIQDEEDHRVAMTFTSLALKKFRVFIGDPKVVNKSYPGFWKDMESAGFRLNNSC